MPVLILGRMPVRTTLRMSIPVGVPLKSSAGIPNAGFSARVISYISRVEARASRAVPLTNVTIAGAAAMANAPIPAVSVIAESPTSGLASAAVNPGKYSPRGVSAGATNHRSPSPLTRIPNSVPLRAIVVTSVLAGIPCAASIVALHAAITGLSATRSLSARYRKAWLCCSVGRPVRTRWGASRRPSSAEPARLRLWPSSPICRA